MWKNYLKITWRNLQKKKAYTLINITGLGIGLACCAFIFMFVRDELSYDTYHEHKDRIFRVVHGSLPEEGGSPDLGSFWVWGNAPIGSALKNDFPEIEKVVQFSGRSDILLTNGDRTFQEDGVFFMDSTVFDVFSWELVEGDPRKALVVPFSIVLTESTARKYFGNEDALGKTLKGSESLGRSAAGDYTVTGIMKDMPLNSHFRFNALLSMSTFHKSRPGVFNEWGYADFYTYFLGNEQFDQVAFEQKIPEFLSRRRGQDDPKYTIVVEPLKDVYLKTPALRQPGETASLANIYVFSVIGFFILAIAMINFMNLSTAQSMERAKEVGIRKSIGAGKKSLIYQFLGESTIIVCLAGCVAIIVMVLAVPLMTALTGKLLSLQNFLNWQTIPFLILVVLVIGVLAGTYPAFVMSGFKPILILKGIYKPDGQGIGLRKALVVLQFSLSIALMASTLIVYFQISHMMDKDLGFDKDQMLIVDYNYDEVVNDRSETIKNRMEKIPSISSAAFSRSVPGSHFPNAGTGIEGPDGDMEWKGQPIFQVGLDFVTHYGLELVAGRSYSRDYPSDSSSALVINEATARQYGYSNPADAVGKKFDQWGRSGEVIGVVKDFNYISLHRNIEPLTLPFSAYSSRYLSLKVNPENLPQTISQIEQIWLESVPHRPFLYSFLDEGFERQYQADLRFRKIITSFSGLAIFIACLGLLGLASYMAKQRTKEIGIRKVLGANVAGIVGLLSKDFVKMVVVAMVIATPVGWYAMDKWLDCFAYKIQMGWWVFLVAGLVALIIALLTVSSQAIKAALTNPVESLRSE